MPFWPYFDPILSPPEPNLWPLAKMCLFRPTDRMDLGGTLRDPNFWPNFDHFGPLWGSWRGRLWAKGHLQSCLWAGGPVWSLSNPCPKPQILVILDHFSKKKVNFVILPIRGSVKMPFWPYFDPFWALLSPEPWPPAKMCLFWPIALEGLEDPQGPYFDLIWPFWTPLRVLRGGAARPIRHFGCLWLEDLLRASKTHARTPNFGHFDHFSYWKSQFCHFAYQGQWKCHFDPILTPFEPSGANQIFWPGIAKMCQKHLAHFALEGPWRDPQGPYKFLTLILTILDPFEGPGGGCS